MTTSPSLSPTSDEKLWTKLRDRVDAILEDRNPQFTTTSPLHPCQIHSNRANQLREDPFLLIRGLDSVAASLSQLTDTLTAAQKGVNDLAKPSRKRANEDGYRKAKRLRGSENCEGNWVDGSCEFDVDEQKEVVVAGEVEEEDVVKNGNMKKAKNLAVSMASKAALLAREMKTVKSELQFMQERCSLLEQENMRLREGMGKDDRQEEDDLVRLQLEALLAEKSRLANENATLTRENQCLHQLVEYHQLTSQDLSTSYDLSMQGTCLDFSSPLGNIDSDSEGERDYESETCNCSDDNLGSTSFPDVCKELQ